LPSASGFAARQAIAILRGRHVPIIAVEPRWRFGERHRRSSSSHRGYGARQASRVRGGGAEGQRIWLARRPEGESTEVGCLLCRRRRRDGMRIDIKFVGVPKAFRLAKHGLHSCFSDQGFVGLGATFGRRKSPSLRRSLDTSDRGGIASRRRSAEPATRS